MDGVTLLVGALVGGGVATLGVALLVVGLRHGRARPTAPGSRKAAASARATRRPLPPPAVRPPEPRPRTASGPAPGALGGETLQLGPVPAWKVPVTSMNAPAPAPRGDLRTAPSVANNNASRRHDPRTATGRAPAR